MSKWIMLKDEKPKVHYEGSDYSDLAIECMRDDWDGCITDYYMSDKLLVCNEKGIVGVGYAYMDVYRYIAKPRTKTFDESSFCMRYDGEDISEDLPEPNAWMPLPEPYTED